MSKNQIYVIVGGGCLLAFCAVVALLAGIFYFTPVFVDQRLFSEIVSVESNPRPNADGNSMGDLDAPIRMVEYGDFQCPFCERFHMNTEPQLVEQFIQNGDVYFTYRSAGNWVSTRVPGNTESQDAALAAYCAADQNQFWEMHDALFANNQDTENQGAFSSRNLLAIAENIGLDARAFQECYDSNQYADEVQRDYDDALASGIQGTPFFVLNYQVDGETKTETISGAQRFEVFQQTIEALLQVADK